MLLDNVHIFYTTVIWFALLLLIIAMRIESNNVPTFIRVLFVNMYLSITQNPIQVFVFCNVMAN